jgi:hypothetical protein
MGRGVRGLLASVLVAGGFGFVVPAVAAAPAGATTSCSPGSFDDTEKVVKVVDKTVAFEVKKLEKVINAKTLNPGDSVSRTFALPRGVLLRTTVSRSADGHTYSVEEDLAKAGASPTFVELGTASRTNLGTVNGVHTSNKHIFFDFDVWAAFLPSPFTGHFDATIVTVTDPTKPAPGTQATETVTFAGISVTHDDPHGPRTGSYTHVGETGLGGDLDFHASIPVPCPGTTMGPVEITVQRQHLDDATGEHTFRRDAMVTGGNLTAGQQSIKFVCGTETQTSTGATVVSSSYTLHKIENADGTTQSFTVKFQNETAPNCNPAFGALVSPNDNSTDWTFPHPLTFPGEW